MSTTTLSLFFFFFFFAFLVETGFHHVGQAGLELLTSGLLTSVSQITATTGVCHHAQLIFVFLVEMGLHHVDQAGLKLLTSKLPKYWDYRPEPPCPASFHFLK